MKCGKILRSFLLVFLLLLSVYCYSLSPGEEAIIQGMTKDELIESVMILSEDKQILTDALTALENLTKEDQKEIENDRILLEEEKTDLAKREDLFLTYSKLQKSDKIKKTILDILIGFVSGYATNEFTP